MEPANLKTECHSTPVQLRVVNPLEIANWDELLQSHPRATVFHTQGWARVLAETYGFTPQYLWAADGHRVWALLPLCGIRSWLTGNRGVSLPFTDHCPPLLSTAFTLEVLFKAALELGRAQNWKTLELRGIPQEFEPASLSFYQHDLDLSRSEAELLEGFEPALRRAIRKAQNSKVRVEVAEGERSMAIYYRLHQLTRQKHGIPPQPYAFFQSINGSLIQKGLGTVMLASIDNRPIAGAVYLRFGTGSVYKFGASDPRGLELRANNLLMWKAILRMKELGATSLSFGRSSLEQEGLRRFKRSFGAKETLVHYTKYSYPTSDFVRGTADRSTGLHAHLFRFCPKPLARLIGTLIYPHIG